MEIAISIGLVLVGAVVGFFVARFMYAQQGSEQAAKAAEKSVKAVMVQQAEHHVFQARQTLQGLKHQIDVLEEQIGDYETQIQPEESTEGMPKMTFFGEQATAMLRNSQRQRKNAAKASSDEQPRDFASTGSSGLFVDNKRQTNAPD
ncbi:ZapG family protein [Alteromonas facilis]|uniref:ZapG family protein n=1 Tax=Alteromonas facilis TaxID=2048004 RepID=UPI000C288F57|nr:DUF1043 family protein [Alteromonas facilis]